MASEDVLRFNPETAPGTTISVRPGGLHTFHKNPRRGDVDAIAGSLKANGQFKLIVVNIGTHTGRPNEVLAGNHTLMAFRQLAERDPFDTRWQQIKVHVVDVDDDMANRIVLVDNRSFEMGEGSDDSIVYDLLKDIGTTGTGYEDADLDRLEKMFENPEENVGGGPPAGEGEDPALPSLPHRDPSAIGYTLVFDDEAQQEDWFTFVKFLKDRYPDPDLTLAERLLEHLADTAGARA